MRRIRSIIFDVFTKVVTFTLIGCATYLMIFFPQVTLTLNFIWQLVLCSFLTCLGSLIYAEDSTKVTIIKCIIHYIYVNIVVMACGLCFDWFNVGSLPQISAMLILIAIVFLAVSAITWRKAVQDANQLNDKLMEYQAQGQNNEE